MRSQRGKEKWFRDFWRSAMPDLPKERVNNILHFVNVTTDEENK